jgi:hypothetical protein
MREQQAFDFAIVENVDKDEKYTYKIKAPIYKPRSYKPHILELADSSRSDALIRKIETSGVDEKEKAFLIEAAKRHTIFNYAKIADYYANSTAEMQSLMEDSALVIIDFDKAIERGFAKLGNDIAEQYETDGKNGG